MFRFRYLQADICITVIYFSHTNCVLIGWKIVKETGWALGNLNFNRTTDGSTDELSACRSWRSRSPLFRPVLLLRRRLVILLKTCVTKGTASSFFHDGPSFLCPVYPSLSPFLLYLPRFKGVVLKRKRRVVLRISLQFLLAPPPLFDSIPPSPSLSSLFLSLFSFARFPKRVLRNSIQERMFIKFYTRAPRRHKSRVPMSNGLLDFGRSTDICIFRSSSSSKGRYPSFHREETFAIFPFIYLERTCEDDEH